MDQIKNFIIRNVSLSRPILLALSGGPDSMYLFAKLCLMRKELGINFAVAHVDHSWRKESVSEALTLHELCAAHHVVFHMKKLNPAEAVGNLEAACRAERLKFFRELAFLYGYQGVFLGHHKDDVAETVLKKVFEGAKIDSLSLPAVAEVEGITLFRPMLHLTKQEILEFLKDKKIAFFADKTNEDLKFTRARMRHYLLPYLKNYFGKNITNPLKRLGEQSEELSAFLDDSLAPFLSKVKVSAFGAALDLSKEIPESNFLLKHLIRRFCLSGGLVLSHTAIDTSALHLEKGTANHQFEGGKYLLAIDRKRLLLLPKESKPLSGRFSLTFGVHTFGPWQVQVERATDSSSISKGWENAFAKGFSLIVPEGKYQLGQADLSAPFIGRRSLDKWWNEYKVPAVLRVRLPVLWHEGAVFQELLTPFSHSNSKISENSLRVSINLLKGNMLSGRISDAQK